MVPDSGHAGLVAALLVIDKEIDSIGATSAVSTLSHRENEASTHPHLCVAPRGDWLGGRSAPGTRLDDSGRRDRNRRDLKPIAAVPPEMPPRML